MMDNGIIDKDKNIYFLHIAGTGGRALKDYVLNPLFGINQEIVGKHDGWSSFIDEKTYIISILREPVQHACGFYLHFIHKDKLVSNAKNDFLNYYRNTKKIHNFQSQNFIASGQNFHYGKGEHFDKYINEIDEDLLQQRVSRVNLLVSQDYMRHNMQKVSNKISSDLDLNYIKLDNFNKLKYTNPLSKSLYNSLTEDEKQEINQYNYIDCKIYSQLKDEELKKAGEL